MDTPTARGGKNVLSCEKAGCPSDTAAITSLAGRGRSVRYALRGGGHVLQPGSPRSRAGHGRAGRGGGEGAECGEIWEGKGGGGVRREHGVRRGKGGKRE